MTRSLAFGLIGDHVMKTILLAASILAMSAPLVLAQGMDHSAAGHGNAASEAPGDARAAFEAANAKMHGAMDVELTGNADVDFARAMIPHHEGAIEMAKIVLEHGEDPEMRALAEEIVAAQEAEIAVMREWLEANAPDGAAPGETPAQ